MDKTNNENLTLGQNFIKDSKLIPSLIKTAKIKSSDTVVDIGTGRGKITYELAKVADKVVSIEKDKRLYEEAKENYANFTNIHFLNIDFLRYKFPERGDYKILSNIPFNSTASFIKKITDIKNPNPPKETYLIVQKEAAKRFSGRDLVASLIFPFFTTRIIKKLDVTKFHPIPDVDIVFFEIKRRNEPLIVPAERLLFSDFLTYIFKSRSSDFYNATKKLLTFKTQKRLCLDNNISMNTMLREIHPAEWINVYKVFRKQATDTQIKVIGTHSHYKRNDSKLKKDHRTRNRFKT
ncbi:MAG: rRNA adenine N-6-methyltransferase family protein [Candidatus Dojkabacteria bacterium]|nr:rRNA adenine N-6-methyltransferase family protein [Candidatus Dojkabacteria bacterium]MDQ7020869.1 rRNA adenine N-6-methyltransferase family protein [Candidatus Dojkabacteria bacterium]